MTAFLHLPRAFGPIKSGALAPRVVAIALSVAASVALPAPAAQAQDIGSMFFNFMRPMGPGCCYHHGYTAHSYRRHAEYPHRAAASHQVAHAKGPASVEPAANETPEPGATEPSVAMKSATYDTGSSPAPKSPNLVIVPPSASKPDTAAQEPARPAPSAPQPGGSTTASSGSSPAKPASSGPGGGSFY